MIHRYKIIFLVLSVIAMQFACTSKQVGSNDYQDLYEAHAPQDTVNIKGQLRVTFLGPP